MAAHSLLFVANPYVVYWTCSGLETAFFSSVLGLGVALLCRKGHSHRLHALGIALLCISALLRPDGFVFLAVSLAIVLLVLQSRFQRLISLGTCFICAALLLPFLFWRSHYFGDNLANPFHAKSGWSVLGVLGQLGTWGGWRLVFSYAAANPFLGALLLIGNILCITKSRSFERLPAVLFFVALAETFYIGSDWMGNCRFLVHALPVAVLGSAIGFNCIRGTACASWRRGVATALEGTLIVLSLGWFLASADNRGRPHAVHLVRGLRAFRIEMVSPCQESANELIWHAPEHCPIGVADIGYVKFTTWNPVVDIAVGLTEPARDGKGRWTFGEEYLRRRLSALSPCALLIKTSPDGRADSPREDCALRWVRRQGYRVARLVGWEEKPDRGTRIEVWVNPAHEWQMVAPEVVEKRLRSAIRYVPYDSNMRRQALMIRDRVRASSEPLAPSISGSGAVDP